MLGAVQSLNADDAKQIANHQLPYWTEQMVLSYLRAHEDAGATVEANDGLYALRWPDGTLYQPKLLLSIVTSTTAAFAWHWTIGLLALSGWSIGVALILARADRPTKE